MPIALILITGILRGGSTVLRTRTMPELNKNTIINMISDKQKGLMEFCVTAQSQKYHYNLPAPSRNFLPAEARTDYRNFNKFKNVLKKRSGICLDTHIEEEVLTRLCIFAISTFSGNLFFRQINIFGKSIFSANQHFRVIDFFGK